MRIDEPNRTNAINAQVTKSEIKPQIHFSETKDEFVSSCKKEPESQTVSPILKLLGVLKSVAEKVKEDVVVPEFTDEAPPEKIKNDSSGWKMADISEAKTADFLETQKEKIPVTAEMPAISFALFKATGNPELDYSDTEKFALHFQDKINKMLKNITPEEVKEVITEVAEETGASEEEVSVAAARLSQFSGWSRTGNLEKELKKAGISGVYETGLLKPRLISKKPGAKNSPVTLNDVIKYISEQKGQLKFDETGTPAIFMDEAQLEYLSKLKETYPKKFEKIRKDVEDGNAIPVIIDGWNAKSGSKSISRTMFGSPCSLKEATVAAITETRRGGKSLDSVMNGNTEFELRELFGENVNYTIIKNTSHPGHTPEEISGNMMSRFAYAEEIRAVIDTLVRDISIEGYGEKEAREIYAKYFDRMLVCHSAETISETMKDQHKLILENLKKRGRTQDDLVFVIPKQNKSFDLVAYQYAKVNGISPSQFIYYDGASKLPVDIYGNKPDLAYKTVVILDDIAGSGKSILYQQFNLIDFAFKAAKDSDIIIAPLVSLKEAEDNVTKMLRKRDLYIPGQIIDFEKAKNSIVTGDGAGIPALRRNYAEKLLGEFGYNTGASCISMPYMLPDNNSGASGLLLSFMLRHNTPTANKNLDLVYEYGDDVRQRLHDIYNEE